MRADATVEGFTLAFGVGSGVMLTAFVLIWLRRADVDVDEPTGPEHRPGQAVEVPAHA